MSVHEFFLKTLFAFLNVVIVDKTLLFLNGLTCTCSTVHIAHLKLRPNLYKSIIFIFIYLLLLLFIIIIISYHHETVDIF